MRIHIFGASGSGTTTLGTALARKLKCKHFDSDNYYWLDIGDFRNPREKSLRNRLLINDLNSSKDCILSGSLCNWDDESIIPYLDLAIFLYIPYALRMKRLLEREKLRFGIRIDEGGDRFQEHREFIEWASKYEYADSSIRSLQMHHDWIKKLPINCLEIFESDTEDQVKMVLNYLSL